MAESLSSSSSPCPTPPLVAPSMPQPSPVPALFFTDASFLPPPPLPNAPFLFGKSRIYLQVPRQPPKPVDSSSVPSPAFLATEALRKQNEIKEIKEVKEKLEKAWEAKENEAMRKAEIEKDEEMTLKRLREQQEEEEKRLQYFVAAVHYAAKHNQWVELKGLMLMKENGSFLTPTFITNLLGRAATCGATEVVQVILEHESSYEVDLVPALLAVIRKCPVDEEEENTVDPIVKLLVCSGRVNPTLGQGRDCPFWCACEAGNAPVVKLLLQHRSVVSGWFSYPHIGVENYPLMIAVRKRRIRVMQLLLEAKATSEISAILAASVHEKDDLEPIRLLLKAKADPETARVKATESLPMLQLLLEFGIDVNMPLAKEETMLGRALSQPMCQFDIASLLLRAKADPNARMNTANQYENDQCAYTQHPLRYPIHYEHKNLVEYMLDCRALPHLRVGASPETPYQMAVRQGSSWLVGCMDRHVEKQKIEEEDKRREALSQLRNPSFSPSTTKLTMVGAIHSAWMRGRHVPELHHKFLTLCLPHLPSEILLQLMHLSLTNALVDVVAPLRPPSASPSSLFRSHPIHCHLNHVMEYLTMDDIIQTGIVCREWRNITLLCPFISTHIVPRRTKDKYVFRNLRRLARLRHLTIQNNDLSIRDLYDFFAMTTLHSLVFDFLSCSHVYYHRVMHGLLVIRSPLRLLDIQCLRPDHTETTTNALLHLSHLTSLRCAAWHITDIPPSTDPSPLMDIQSLDLLCTRVNDASLLASSKHLLTLAPRLSSLTINGPGLSPFLLQLPRYPFLTSLKMQDYELTSPDFEILVQLRLITLHCAAGNTEEEEKIKPRANQLCVSVAQMTTLEELVISHLYFPAIQMEETAGEMGIKGISNLPRLQKLGFIWCKALPSLVSLVKPPIKHLILNFSTLHAPPSIENVTLLQSMPFLQTLELKDVASSDYWDSTISALLINHPKSLTNIVHNPRYQPVQDGNVKLLQPAPAEEEEDDEEEEEEEEEESDED